MFIKQISAFVENKPGRMAEITKIIAESGSNMRALSLADSTSFGILRIIVDDTEKVLNAMKKNKITASVTDVLCVKIPDTPGGLLSVLELLSNNDIDVSYMYAFISKDSDDAYVVMRIEEDKKAEELLSKAGF